MKKKQIRSNRKDKIKLILCFKDGREIKAEDFDADTHLTEKQNAFVAGAFEKVFLKPR